MPKYRSLHAKILDSFDFNDMPNDFTRLFWVLLPLVLDCEGRAINNTAWIKSKIYPLRTDVTNEQVADAMVWLSNRKMVACYTVDGHQYFYVPTFKDYQRGTDREATSVLPGPTPELLASYSRSDSYTDSNTYTEAEAITETATIQDGNLSLVIDSYKHYIGKCTPIMENILKNAIPLYDITWFAKAFEIAAGSGHKRWDYAEGILKNWKANGQSPGGNGRDRVSVEGRSKYGEWEK